MALDSHTHRLHSAYVVVKIPDTKDYLGDGSPLPIILDGGEGHVVVLVSVLEKLPSGAEYICPDMTSWDGTALAKIPSDWCVFLLEEEAENLMGLYEADRKLLSYAH